MWNDPRLAYSDGPEYIHFGYDTAKSFIWMPDLFFEQSTTQITESFKRDAFVQIKPTGDIRVSVRWGKQISFLFFKNKSINCVHSRTDLLDSKTRSDLLRLDKHRSFFVLANRSLDAKNWYNFVDPGLTITILSLRPICKHCNHFGGNFFDTKFGIF